MSFSICQTCGGSGCHNCDENYEPEGSVYGSGDPSFHWGMEDQPEDTTPFYEPKGNRFYRGLNARQRRDLRRKQAVALEELAFDDVPF